jgi:hypothetical protein
MGTKPDGAFSILIDAITAAELLEYVGVMHLKAAKRDLPRGEEGPQISQ